MPSCVGHYQISESSCAPVTSQSPELFTVISRRESRSRVEQGQAKTRHSTEEFGAAFSRRNLTKWIVIWRSVVGQGLPDYNADCAV